MESPRPEHLESFLVDGATTHTRHRLDDQLAECCEYQAGHRQGAKKLDRHPQHPHRYRASNLRHFLFPLPYLRGFVLASQATLHQ